MKKRYLYALLFAIPVFLLSLPVSVNIYVAFLDLNEIFVRAQIMDPKPSGRVPA